MKEYFKSVKEIFGEEEKVMMLILASLFGIMLSMILFVVFGHHST